MVTRGRRPTIADVARAAGVSVTTVSAAMSGKGRIDPATRARVQEAARAAGWTPRRAAQALRSGRTGTIALCIPPDRSSWADWMRHSSYLQQLTAACAAATIDAGRLMLLAPRPAERVELAGLDVDGLLLLDPVRADPVVRMCAAAGVALVTVDREPGSTSPWWVGNDHRAATRGVLDHLHERGARSVALLTGAERWAWLEDAHAAYAQWCAERGAPPLVRALDMDRPADAAAHATSALLAAGERPDAVLALPTHAALGVLAAARAAGLDVPGDLRVVAGVDGPEMAAARPAVTALDLRPAELGARAVAMLVRRLGGEPPTGPDLVATDLLVRASS
ncbi:hypothetical protein BJF78_19855 [Pseudonocardia sp. CNS-139]|nr:hypothetical protein BJF78_19855 [Pseudonocardia sp. CNS-139]